MGFFDRFGKKGKVEDAQGEAIELARPIEIVPEYATAALDSNNMSGKCLIASPFMDDRRFRHAVVFICSHTAEGGAMGLVINHAVDEPDFVELLKQFDITASEDTPDLTMLAGGPVEATRGFVLHSKDYRDKGTRDVTDDLCLSTSVDVLQALADGKGPEKAILALGYTGWDAGQLERELGEHVWMIVDTDSDLLFEVSCNHRWQAALGRLGVELSGISYQSGRA